MIFCFQDSVKKFASVTDKEIVVIPNGEKEEEEVFSNKNIISWKNFLARGCESDSEIDGCASDNFNDTVLIFWSQFNLLLYKIVMAHGCPQTFFQGRAKFSRGGGGAKKKNFAKKI
jgi:hypothetical protein